jgi:hypothetical protein
MKTTQKDVFEALYKAIGDMDSEIIIGELTFNNVNNLARRVFEEVARIETKGDDEPPF